MTQNKKRFEKEDLTKVAVALAKKGEFNSKDVSDALKAKGFDVTNRDRINKLLYDYARNPANKLDSKPSAGIPEHTVYFRESAKLQVAPELVAAIAAKGPQAESKVLKSREFLPKLREETHKPRIKLTDAQVLERIDFVLDHEALQKKYPPNTLVLSRKNDRRRKVMLVDGDVIDTNAITYYDTSNKVGDYHEVRAWRLKNYGTVLRKEQERRAQKAASK